MQERPTRSDVGVQEMREVLREEEDESTEAHVDEEGRNAKQTSVRQCQGDKEGGEAMRWRK